MGQNVHAQDTHFLLMHLHFPYLYVLNPGRRRTRVQGEARSTTRRCTNPRFLPTCRQAPSNIRTTSFNAPSISPTSTPTLQTEGRCRHMSHRRGTEFPLQASRFTGNTCVRVRRQGRMRQGRKKKEGGTLKAKVPKVPSPPFIRAPLPPAALIAPSPAGTSPS